MKIDLNECAGLIPDADHSDVLVAVACKLMNACERKIHFFIHPSIKSSIKIIEGAEIHTRKKINANTFIVYSISAKNKIWIGRYGIFPELRNQINSK